MQRPYDDPHADHLPNTAFTAAFLKALERLIARSRDRSTKIPLPTGPACIGEIELVLRALGLVQDRTRELRIREPNEMPAAAACDQLTAGKVSQPKRK